ncbi:MAG: DUF2079 domain-containing protein [Candidatus Omnitrophota bacterium]
MNKTGNVQPNTTILRNTLLSGMGKLVDRYATSIVLVFITAYVVIFSAISILRYNSFDYSDFDFAIYAQVLWNMLHGSIQSSILGIVFLGNHLDIILFLLLPIYAVFKSPLTLLVLQSICIGLGALPLYLLGKDVINKKFALLFSLLYLLYPALQYVNHYEFHPDAFVICALLFMFYYFEKGCFIPFIAFVCLSLSCKENIAMGIFFFGFYVLFFQKRKWKWGLVAILMAGLWALVGLKLMHHFNKGIIDFNSLYSHIGDSMAQVVINVLTHPLVTLRFILSERNLKFLFQLFFPLAFLSLLSPKVLCIALPFFLQQLLSQRQTDHVIFYHYGAKLIPFIFISAIYGTRFLLKLKIVSRFRFLIPVVLISSSLISSLQYGLLAKLPLYLSVRYAKHDIDYYKEELIRTIPPQVAVVATFEFLPKLSQRRGLYSFHHVYTGKYTLSDQDYTLPEETDYALIDFDDYLTFTSFYLPRQYENLQNFLRGDTWGLIKAAGNIGLFKKGDPAHMKLVEPMNGFSQFSPERFVIEEYVIADKYVIDSRKVTPGGLIASSFVWECAEAVDKDYWIVFKLVDEKGKTVFMFNHPICYRIYPTYSWKTGDVLKENIWIPVPRVLKTKTLWLKAIVFDRNTADLKTGSAQTVRLQSNREGAFDQDGWLTLAKIEVDIEKARDK